MQQNSPFKKSTSILYNLQYSLFRCLFQFMQSYKSSLFRGIFQFYAMLTIFFVQMYASILRNKVPHLFKGLFQFMQSYNFLFKSFQLSFLQHLPFSLFKKFTLQKLFRFNPFNLSNFFSLSVHWKIEWLSLVFVDQMAIARIWSTLRFALMFNLTQFFWELKVEINEAFLSFRTKLATAMSFSVLNVSFQVIMWVFSDVEP
jgi:hypothetical protein